MRIFPWCLIMLISLGVHAQQKEENVELTKGVESCTFRYNKKRGAVEVVQTYNNLYTSLKYRDDAAFFEFFDDQTTLDEVALLENGKRSYASAELKPHSVDGIFYSDAKVYSLPLRFAKAGATNEVTLQKTVLDPRYFCTVYFPEVYGIREKIVEVVIPRWMKVEIRELNFEGYNITKETVYQSKEDADLVRYTVRNLPASKRESNQPGGSYFLPHLLFLVKSATAGGKDFTYFSSLKEQYGWYRSLTATLKTDEALMKQKAAEITAGVSGDLEKVKAVLYWVHEHIRYIAFEEGIAGFKPDEAQGVLNKKYGDCKGMANLTKELLKALGFDARLAWIGTNSIAYDYTTPALCVDNHMITCLVYKGRRYFLDGTETFLPFDTYAERIQGRPVLIEDGEQYILDRIPQTNVAQNLTKFTEKMQIDGETLQGKVNYLYRGECKEGMLNNFMATKKDELHPKLERYISNDNNAYAVSNVRISDLHQIDNDLTVDFDLKYKGAVSSFGNELYLDIDYNKTLSKTKIDTATRKTDYVFPYKLHFQTDITVAIPAGYKVGALPAPFKYDHPSFLFEIKYEQVGNSIHYEKTLQLKKASIARKDFRQWNEAVAGLAKKYLEQVTFTK